MSDIRTRINELIKEFYNEMSAVDNSENTEIKLSAPAFDHNEAINAMSTILDGWISQGPNVKKFEASFSKYVGCTKGIAVNSGSSANLLAIQALKIKYKIPEGSEVIIPAATFATVAMPIIQLGFIPVYVDVETDSFNIDPKEVEKGITDKTRIVMPVHTLGYPAEMEDMMALAKKHDLFVLEDCCEAHGSKIGDKKVGSWGDLATFSFFVAHNMTTGEGGMIITNDEELQNICRSLREFGRYRQKDNNLFYSDDVLNDYDKRYVFERLGYNVRMTDITAALGNAQLIKLDSMNDRRRHNAARLQKQLAEGAGEYLEFQGCKETYFHTYYTFPVVLTEKALFTRRVFSEHLESKGIETRPLFGGCLPDQPAFRNEPGRSFGDLSVSRNLRDRLVFVGIHPCLTDSQIDYVAEVILDFINDNK